MYRPPNDGIETLSKLEHRLNEMSVVKGNVIVAGDLNLPNVTWESGSGGDGKGQIQNMVSDIMDGGFCQVVSEGTRFNRTGGCNLLDVVLLRPQELFVRSRVVEGISDHKVPIVMISMGVDNSSSSGKKIWRFKKGNPKEVQRGFDERWDEYSKIDNDVEQLWHSFKTICKDVREDCIPSKILGSNPDPPYFNNKIQKFKKKARRLNARFRRSGEGGNIGSGKS